MAPELRAHVLLVELEAGSLVHVVPHLLSFRVLHVFDVTIVAGWRFASVCKGVI